MDVLMGLLAALMWGGTDFLVGLNARAVGVKRAVFFGQMVGFTITTALLLFFPSVIINAISVSVDVWLFGFLASSFTVLGALAISKAFALGKASIVAPVVTSYGVVTTLLSWASGEYLTVFQLVFIVVCVFGVILSSVQPKSDAQPGNHTRKSILFAILAAMLYGTSFWLQGRFTLQYLGPIAMLWLSYAVGITILLFMMINVKNGLRIPRPRSCFLLIATSLLNLGGFSAFSWGTALGSVSIVTVISTLSGGVAAILGFLFFKERLGMIQISGVLLVILGAVMLHS
ncbi:EamA family transporter [Pseudomonas syringae]|uniref:EamA domain-containing protein n=2 Tax=Pseudomonas syringae TaxID=317 RepID=A0A0Q0IQL0_PSEAP|nr:EamA family transporter [Pseudomonas syringae]KEZ75256.1 membrane protein [Pseudomonas syringae pv. syringae FF5]KFF83320.1 membrane protein [Pseudomonas syringae pv. syringae]KPZ03655.1 hypothetical protein ALO85_200034 [Pseudomonas syringae pv. aptata]MBS7417484.1 DMT family transporter [Pseudomonas syringae]MBS7436383.1 DMT family transporter [Pseudomonas syringae]